MRKPLIYLTAVSLSVVIFQNCTSTISVSVMHPADISIPADLDSLILIDRTKTINKGTKVGRVLESVITGEPIAGDRNGVNETMMHLIQVLNQNERVTLSTTRVFEVPNINGMLKYDIPIRAEIIDSLAENHHADGVLALEYFDSDRIINGRQNTSESFVWTYWRLYYPNDHQVVDEIKLQTYGRRDYSYTTIIPAGYSSIVRAGVEAADRYVKRILPSWYTETRSYYTKGCDELKMAKQSFKISDWEQAKYTLQMGMDQQYSTKIVGRLSYNLAVVCEQLGELEEGLNYAYKSAESGNSKAPFLIQILKTRLNEIPLIEDQMIRE